MKVLVDDMYDGFDDDLRGMGYDAYSVRKLRGREPGMKDDYFVVGYAKEKGMAIVTADTGMAWYCRDAGVRHVLIDKEKLLPVIRAELDGLGGA